MSNIDTIEIDTIDDKTSIGGKYWLAKVDCDVGISMQEAEHGQILSNLTCTLIESYFDNGVEINTIEDKYAFVLRYDLLCWCLEHVGGGTFKKSQVI